MKRTKTIRKSAEKKRIPSLIELLPKYKKSQYKDFVSSTNDQYISELREAYLHKGLVLYIGAGVSKSIGLPSWPELIRSLTVAMMLRKVGTASDKLLKLNNDDFWRAINDIQEDIEKTTDIEKPILMMARSIKDEFQKLLPAMISRRLYSKPSLRAKYRPTLRNKSRDRKNLPSSKLVDSIICLSRSERDVKGVQAIINYNYDDFIEEKLREENVRCVTVKSGKDRLTTGALPAFHVHGVLPLRFQYKRNKYNKADTIGNFVFSEDEYHEEYSDPYRWSNMTQMNYLGRYIGLFVGLSLEDPNIRRLIDVTHKQYPEISNYAILSRKSSLYRARDSKVNTLRNMYEDV